jgi:hypothetical protein
VYMQFLIQQTHGRMDGTGVLPGPVGTVAKQVKRIILLSPTTGVLVFPGGHHPNARQAQCGLIPFFCSTLNKFRVLLCVCD